jgi:hypothetical protein
MRDARIAFVLLGVEGLVLVGWQMYGGANPWSVPVAETPFTRPLAVCRGGLLLAAIWALVALPPRRHVGLAVLVVAVFSVSAVALSLYVLAFLLAMAAIVGFGARDAEFRRRGAIAGWSLVTIATLLFVAHPRVAPLPGQPQESAAAWLARDNLFRARWAALQWSALERASGTLGDGTLLRAELEQRLGRTASALDALSEIQPSNATPETRRRAAFLVASWTKEEQPRARSSVPDVTPRVR